MDQTWVTRAAVDPLAQQQASAQFPPERGDRGRCKRVGHQFDGPSSRSRQGLQRSLPTHPLCDRSLNHARNPTELFPTNRVA